MSKRIHSSSNIAMPRLRKQDVITNAHNNPSSRAVVSLYLCLSLEDADGRKRSDDELKKAENNDDRDT